MQRASFIAFGPKNENLALQDDSLFHLLLIKGKWDIISLFRTPFKLLAANHSKQLLKHGIQFRIPKRPRQLFYGTKDWNTEMKEFVFESRCFYPVTEAIVGFPWCRKITASFPWSFKHDMPAFLKHSKVYQGSCQGCHVEIFEFLSIF